MRFLQSQQSVIHLFLARRFCIGATEGNARFRKIKTSIGPSSTRPRICVSSVRRDDDASSWDRGLSNSWELIRDVCQPFIQL